MTDQEAADAVKSAVATLNAAIKEAHAKQIAVEIRTQDRSYLNSPVSLAIVDAICHKAL